MRQRAGGGKLNRGHNFHQLSRGPSMQHHSNCWMPSLSCCHAGCLVAVSAFCVQRKAFLALHHLSLHHLHLKCNSSDFFHDSYIPEDGWTGSRTDVHLCSHIYWALIWNGTARVTNLICHFYTNQRLTLLLSLWFRCAGTLLSAVNFLPSSGTIGFSNPLNRGALLGTSQCADTKL